MKNFVVAIDGPAGSGKSSISKLVCSKLGFTHIDTGAMYRAVTLEALKRKIDVENENEYSFIDEIDVVYKDGKVFLNGEDVSGFIRTSEVTNNASAVSRVKAVRDKMVDFQRGCRNYGNILMDGRDIGTCVLPNAQVKIYLTASSKVRAERRYKELQEKGVECNLEDIEKDIIDRDYRDMHREVSPLKQAIDAVLLDSSTLDIDGVVEKMKEIIQGA